MRFWPKRTPGRDRLPRREDIISATDSERSQDPAALGRTPAAPIAWFPLMPKLASVIYRIFEGEELAVVAAQNGETHHFGGELVLTFQDGPRRFVSWVGEPVRYAVGIKGTSHFPSGAVLSDVDLTDAPMWAGLVGKELWIGFVAVDNQMLKVSASESSVFVCSFERGCWWADELTISKNVSVPYDAGSDSCRPVA